MAKITQNTLTGPSPFWMLYTTKQLLEIQNLNWGDRVISQEMGNKSGEGVISREKILLQNSKIAVSQYICHPLLVLLLVERSKHKLSWTMCLPAHTRPSLVWWNRELTLKCKFKCFMKPMKDPRGVSPSKGNQGTTRGKENFLLTSVGIEPTTSGLDLPLLCRLSYEVGQRPTS